MAPGKTKKYYTTTKNHWKEKELQRSWNEEEHDGDDNDGETNDDENDVEDSVAIGCVCQFLQFPTRNLNKRGSEE